MWPAVGRVALTPNAVLSSSRASSDHARAIAAGATMRADGVSRRSRSPEGREADSLGLRESPVAVLARELPLMDRLWAVATSFAIDFRDLRAFGAYVASRRAVSHSVNAVLSSSLPSSVSTTLALSRPEQRCAPTAFPRRSRRPEGHEADSSCLRESPVGVLPREPP